MKTTMSRRTFVMGACGLLCTGSALLSGCGTGNGGVSKAAGFKTVTDMGSTQKSVPSQISRVFCTNPIGSANLCCLAPKTMVGWNFKPTAAKGYIADEYLSLPSLGVWMGAGNTPNPEEIAQQDPDVLLCFWTADDAGRSMVEEIESQTSMTTLLVDYSLPALPESYRFLGSLLGCEKRAEKLARYCEDMLRTIEDVAAKVPQGKRASIYLAQSTGGLSTDPVGSMHVTDALELCGVDNVADLPGTVGQGMGMPTVNIEQIIEWNPTAVLVSEYVMGDSQTSDLYSEILASDDWRNVGAVRKKRVYGIPQAPFSWFGRPPSTMRLLGCLMLQKLLYPQLTQDIDIRREAKSFFKLFFDCDVTRKQLDELLAHTGL